MVRTRHDDKLALLATLPLFGKLDKHDLRRVAELCTRTEVDAGTVLCREGHRGQEFFVVVGGEATVTVEGVVVDEAAGGDFFGELALLGSGWRTATVTADTAMSLLVFSTSEFNVLLQDEPQVGVAMLPVLATRRQRVGTRGPVTPQ